MNQDLKDKRIRELFHELNEEDERRTPGFTAVMRAALLRRRPARGSLGWRVAAAVALPAIAVVVGLALLGNPWVESLPPIDSTVVQRLPFPRFIPNDAPPPPGPILGPEHFRSVRHRQPASRTHVRSIHISLWQSPTDFLLKTPGSEYLRNLPRMTDSTPAIPRSLPDNHN